jgi:hypothetical protein
MLKQSAIAILQHTGTFNLYDLRTRSDYNSVAIRRQHRRSHSNESVRSRITIVTLSCRQWCTALRIGHREAYCINSCADVALLWKPHNNTQHYFVRSQYHDLTGSMYLLKIAAFWDTTPWVSSKKTDVSEVHALMMSCEPEISLFIS